MTGYEQVSYVAFAIGETDVSVQIVAHDTHEVYWFVTEIIGRTPGVQKTTTSIVPQVLKDVYQWHIPPSMRMNGETSDQSLENGKP
jgi:DNA-binding Lrp family transcriptional regulator